MFAVQLHWQTVRFLALNSIPELLFRATFDEEGYSIQITDLSQIWSETLDCAAIRALAKTCDCSIDVNDDTNFIVLMNKIAEALASRTDTSISLESASMEKMQFILSSPLPDPLPQLRWPITLQRQENPALGDQFVRPLIEQIMLRESQLRELIDEIGSKDRVISKLTDRLEASGSDLTVVFPGMSRVRKTNKKQSQRVQLADHVRGLGDFDEVVWREHSKSQQLRPNTNISSLDSIFKDASDITYFRGPEANKGPWWANCHIESEVGFRSTARPSVSELNRTEVTSSHENDDTSDDTTDDGEFQHQELPGLSETVLRPADRPSGGSTEAVSDGNDAPMDVEGVADGQDSRRSRQSGDQLTRTEAVDAPNSTALMPPTRSRLGKIGGKRKDTDSRAETGANGDAKSFSASPSMEKSEASPPNKGSMRLGVIGGRMPPADRNVKRENASISDNKHTSADSVDISTAQSTRSMTQHQNIGVDSGRKTEPVRETSEERIIRRREELKRQTEDTQKPIKKKRKF